MIDIPVSRHQKIALCCSGGKDSLAVLYLLRPLLDRITVYHMDTGDLLPEIIEVVEHVQGIAPHFVHVRSDANAWMAENGMPTDLLPYSAHEVGRVTGQEKTRLVGRYECCFANLMWPLIERIQADGNTLVIRGTRKEEMARIPAPSGAVLQGLEFWNPIEDWSRAEVMDYLKSQNAPIPRLYGHMVQAPECARCPAWWSEKRAAYLREFHPNLARDYSARLRIIAAEIEGSIRDFQAELQACGEVS
jgi:phosphoadenosine phosphosulfate reductase